jgi:hypothetical protein
MIVRALSSSGDFTFGNSQSDYISANAAIEQCIQTALNSFLGNCFFAANAGIDWYNLLGGKNELAISLAINTTILGVQGVTGILQTSINLGTNRNLTIQYSVTTVYSTLTSTYAYNFLI